MGVIYSVACKTCKVTRDLDKYYEARSVDSRDDALKLTDELSKKSFRTALLVSFMVDHAEHDCVFFNEHSDCVEELEPFFDNEYKEDFDYWRTRNTPIHSYPSLPIDAHLFAKYGAYLFRPIERLAEFLAGRKKGSK